MTPYLVYLPPGARRDSRHALFIADQFAWPAFVSPGLWLLYKRQWGVGALVVLLQGAVMAVGGLAETALAGALVELALRLLVALEGPTFLARRLERRGHSLAAILPAPDLETAEAMYGAMLVQENPAAEGPAGLPHRRPNTVGSATADPANPGFGPFDTYGSR